MPPILAGIVARCFIRRAQAEAGGGARRIAAQHAKGKLRDKGVGRRAKDGAAKAPSLGAR